MSLLELGPEALPRVMAEFDARANTEIRSDLVHVVWQYRDPRAIDFLGRCLSDPDPDVWHEALDGLVTLGRPRSVLWLELARGAIIRGRDPRNGITLEWLDEALGQIEEPVERPRPMGDDPIDPDRQER